MTDDPLKGLTPLELAAKSITARGKDWMWFQRLPLEEFYFTAWRLYFNLMLRDEISDVMAAAMLKELRNRNFTNGDMSAAGDMILQTCRRWPLLVDFLKAKDPTVHNESDD